MGNPFFRSDILAIIMWSIERVLLSKYHPHSPQYYDRTLPLREVQRYFVISTVLNIHSWLVSYAWHAAGWNQNTMIQIIMIMPSQIKASIIL